MTEKTDQLESFELLSINNPFKAEEIASCMEMVLKLITTVR